MFKNAFCTAELPAGGQRGGISPQSGPLLGGPQSGGGSRVAGHLVKGDGPWPSLLPSFPSASASDGGPAGQPPGRASLSAFALSVPPTGRVAPGIHRVRQSRSSRRKGSRGSFRGSCPAVTPRTGLYHPLASSFPSFSERAFMPDRAESGSGRFPAADPEPSGTLCRRCSPSRCPRGPSGCTAGRLGKGSALQHTTKATWQVPSLPRPWRPERGRCESPEPEGPAAPEALPLTGSPRRPQTH